MFLIACAVLLLDQSTKLMVRLRLGPGESIPVIRNILHINLVHNKGAAFSLFQDQTVILTGISILSLVIILLFYRQIARSGQPLRIGFGLIVGGTLGNLVDRLWHGYVVDFLDFQIWPVFNVADSAITVGVLLLLWKTIVKSKNLGQRCHRS